MTGKTFVDTNILVYAENADQGRKHERSRELILDLWDTQSGVLSIQVLQEFYVVTTRKLPVPLSSRAALEIVEQYLTWQVVDNTGSLLLAACSLADKHRLSFWDALIVQAALGAGCARLLTEDLNHGQQFGELTVVNPFR